MTNPNNEVPRQIHGDDRIRAEHLKSIMDNHYTSMYKANRSVNPVQGEPSEDYPALLATMNASYAHLRQAMAHSRQNSRDPEAVSDVVHNHWTKHYENYQP